MQELTLFPSVLFRIIPEQKEGVLCLKTSPFRDSFPETPDEHFLFPLTRKLDILLQSTKF